MIPLFSFNAKPLHMELYSLLEIMSYCQGGWVDELCEPVLPSTATTVLPLAVEEHCGNRWPEVVKCCKVSCVEVLSPSRRINCLPNILSEEHKHNAMNPCCWPRVLVADYFISWKLEGKAKLLRFISELERWVCVYIYIFLSLLSLTKPRICWFRYICHQPGRSSHRLSLCFHTWIKWMPQEKKPKHFVIRMKCFSCPKFASRDTFSNHIESGGSCYFWWGLKESTLLNPLNIALFFRICSFYFDCIMGKNQNTQTSHEYL